MQTSGRVLCAAGDGRAYEWDLSLSQGSAAGKSPVRAYEGHKGYLHAVAVSVDCGLSSSIDRQPLEGNTHGDICMRALSKGKGAHEIFGGRASGENLFLLKAAGVVMARIVAVPRQVSTSKYSIAAVSPQ